MVGGKSSHIPLKVNTAGVIPVIFASSIMSMPVMIAQFFNVDYSTFGGKILMALSSANWFRPEMLEIIASLHREEYYINMAAAWYYSVALVKQYETTLPLFTEKRLDKWLHNKSLQKAIESYRIDKEKKDYLRSLKVK